MRRTPWFRALASLLAFWLPLVAGEPGVLQPCPMHGAGHAIAASMHGSMHGSMHMTSSAAAMHAHHASHHASSNTKQPGHNHHDCTCIDCCAVGGALLRAPDAPRVEIATLIDAPLRSVPSVESLARPAPEFARPYTTGPPRA
ncbi:MAG TPA: hypothetical protein VN706_25645 [Gemmatimonadaceae bacterium]|nr:hypothetical protein [Gemmatimonadaceae bacterium]